MVFSRSDINLRDLFPFALKALYHLEAISGEAIIEWSVLESTSADLVASVSELIEYLGDDEDDSDDDSDD